MNKAFAAAGDAAACLAFAPSADQRIKGQVQVFAKLQPPVWMGQGHHVPDQIGDPLHASVGYVVHRDDNHIVADAHAPVFAPVAG